MARRRRNDIEGGVHHVMNRGVNRQAIFFGDQDRIEFGRRLADIHDLFEVETLAYCLMGNHYHLLLRAPAGGLSRAMQRLGSLYTRRTNQRVGRDGPLFRSRFHSIRVTTDAYLMMAMRYIHRNPLELPGVRAIGDYRWSSYRTYLGLRPAPSFVRTEVLAGLFGGDRGSLQAFHADHESASVADLGPHRTAGTTHAELIQLAQFVLAVDDLRSGDDTTAAPYRDRTLLLLMLDHFGGAGWAADLEQALQFPSPAARRMALSRARQRREADPSIARAATDLVRLLPIDGAAA